MICQNPECGIEFEPEREGQVYHCHKCRNRAMKIRETQRRRAKAAETIATKTHPCKRCGGAAGYKQVYCDACKATPKGAGVLPLVTPRIRAARQREQAAIDRVVAKARANGSQGWRDDNYQGWWQGGLHGHKIG